MSIVSRHISDSEADTLADLLAFTVAVIEGFIHFGISVDKTTFSGNRENANLKQEKTEPLWSF